MPGEAEGDEEIGAVAHTVCEEVPTRLRNIRLDAPRIEGATIVWPTQSRKRKWLGHEDGCPPLSLLLSRKGEIKILKLYNNS